MTGTRDKSHAELAILTLLVVSAGAVYFSTLDLHGFWLDEIRSAVDLRLGFYDMIKSRSENGHPPVFFSLLWVWQRTAGDSEASLRVLPALFALACGPALYAALRPLTSRGAALLAAGLLLFAPLQISLGQMARNYSLVVLLTLLSVGVVVRAERDRADGKDAENWPRLLALCALSLLLLETHYCASLIVGTMAGALLMRPRPYWRLGGAVLLAGVLFLPWLISSLGPRPSDPEIRLGWIGSLAEHPPWLLVAKPWFLRVRSLDPATVLAPVALTTGLLLMSGARQVGRRGLSVIAVALGPPIVAFLAHLAGFLEIGRVARYFAGSLSLIVGLVALGLAGGINSGGWKRVAASILLSAVVGLSVFQIGAYFERGLNPPWREVSHLILAQKRDDEIVAFPATSHGRNWIALLFYMPEPVLPFGEPERGARRRNDPEGYDPIPATPGNRMEGPEVGGIWVYFPGRVKPHHRAEIDRLRESFPRVETLPMTHGNIIHMQRER